MNVNHYIGFDVHKKSVSYCVKTADGRIVEEGKLPATHQALRQWAQKRKEPWFGAMEATLFSGWIYDTLKPFAVELQMGHPAMMKAIGASKKKNDKLDARKVADLVRCDLLPACYVAPVEIRELRRMLRYRNLVVGQAVRMKNKMSGLLMEVGAKYNKQQLHGKKYFTGLLETVEEVPESVKDMLRLSRGALEMFETVQHQLLMRLQTDSRLGRRVTLLKSIRGVGEVTALTWVLEVGDPQRFSSVAHAVSYCGLTSALVSSADKQQRGPISKQRNAHLQTVLVEAAKLAPRGTRRRFRPRRTAGCSSCLPPGTGCSRVGLTSDARLGSESRRSGATSCVVAVVPNFLLLSLGRSGGPLALKLTSRRSRCPRRDTHLPESRRQKSITSSHRP